VLAGWKSSASVPLAGGWALSRDALDQTLVAAATTEGVIFEDGAHARLLPSSEPVRRLSIRDRDGERLVAARVVVAADGLGGALLRAGQPELREKPHPDARVGLGTRLAGSAGGFEPGTITMAVAEEGYVGLVRVEDDSLNVAAAVDPALLTRSAAAGVGIASLVRRAGLPVPEGLEDADWRGTPALTRQARTLAADRVFRVGDATGYVEPFTGEGMCWALAEARALAPIAAQAAERWERGLVRRWEEIHARSIGRSQRACRAAAWALRRPSLARLVLDALATSPALATPFVRAVSVCPTP
jgi:flavin-dependent dehydrogenase